MAMNRRRSLSLLGAGGVSIAGGMAALEPSLVTGSPRGEGDPISIERTINDEQIEYRPSTDEGRFPTLVKADGTVAYETQPFVR